LLVARIVFAFRVSKVGMSSIAEAAIQLDGPPENALRVVRRGGELLWIKGMNRLPGHSRHGVEESNSPNDRAVGSAQSRFERLKDIVHLVNLARGGSVVTFVPVGFWLAKDQLA